MKLLLLLFLAAQTQTTKARLVGSWYSTSGCTGRPNLVSASSSSTCDAPSGCMLVKEFGLYYKETCSSLSLQAAVSDAFGDTTYVRQNFYKDDRYFIFRIFIVTVRIDAIH